MIFKWMMCITMSRCAFGLPEAQTQYGPIEGKTITLFNGKNVDAFLGIPYAAPPTGPYRFTSPQPPNPWNTTLETKALSKPCFQAIKDEVKPYYWFMTEEPESEDCLYLNVWRPGNNRNINLPVMVWIHGGGYIAGSASASLYDGSILASENDVILVTMNYRLDVFGFLYFNSSDVAENVGLQDQIRAMKWVRENIQNFGGDPTRVTLFGESSGGFNIGFHLVNPQLDQLFQYVIMESGTLNSEGSSLLPADAYERSRNLAETVGCLREDMQEMMICLRKLSPRHLLKGVSDMSRFVKLNPRAVRNGAEVPLDIHTAAQKVPPSKRKNVLMGNVPREAGHLLTCFLPQETFSIDINVTEKDIRTALTNILGLPDIRLQNVVLHEYNISGFSTSDPEKLNQQVADFLGDVIFTWPSILLAKSYASPSNQAYYYYFDHMPSRPIKAPIPKWMGVIHGDELPFVFGAPLIPSNGYTSDEVTLSKTIMTFWTNFAKTGNPNGGNGQNIWSAVEPNGTFNYLILDKSPRLETNLKTRECNFWDSIYPQLLSLQTQLQNTGRA